MLEGQPAGRLGVARARPSARDLIVRSAVLVVLVFASDVACGGVVGTAKGDAGADADASEAAAISCADAGTLEHYCCHWNGGPCPANWTFAQGCHGLGPQIYPVLCDGFVAELYEFPDTANLYVFDSASGELTAALGSGAALPWGCGGARDGTVTIPRRCLDVWLGAGSQPQPCNPNDDFVDFCSVCRDNCTCLGDACSSGSPCCSGNCDPSLHQCACVSAGAQCIDEECCAGLRCDFNTGTCSSTCTAPNGSCASNRDCCSASCNAMYHECDPCRESGTACEVAGDCCSSMCVQNVCL